ncbi:MAG: DoxX family protein [Bacteroidia bacterium]|nr:DoxX family protein [Bacteroidia bacterium]
MNLLNISSLLMALIFFYYGLQCLFSEEMKSEFKRFKLRKIQRKLTGLFQLLGAAGLITGVFYPLIGTIASFGLGLLMFLGFLVRLKIKDSMSQTFPSLFLTIVNFVICYCYIRLS